MLEPLSRWLQVLLLRGRELIFGGGLSDPALVALPAIALSLLVGVVLLVVVVFVQGRGHHAAASASRALPIDQHLLLETSAASWKKPKPHEELKKKKRKEKAKEPVNGHPPFSNGIQLHVVEETKDSQATEKKSLKAKKKKRVDEKPKDKNLAGNKEKTEEEAGDWVTKISNREKRQQRKERQKKKCDVTCIADPTVPLYSDGNRAASRTVKDYRGSDDQEETIAWKAPSDSAGDAASNWNEATDKPNVWHFPRGADTSTVGWGPSDKPVAPSGWGVATKDLSSSGADWETVDSVEKDIFSNIGTWDNKAGVKNPPVTFGAFPDPPETNITQDNTSSQGSPARCHLSATLSSHVIDEAWLGLDDPFAVDLNSDWSPPTEEWGNWTGEEILIVQEVEKEKLKISEEEEEKSQMNPASSGKSKRKKRRKKGKHIEDSVGREVMTMEKPGSVSHDEPGKMHPVTPGFSDIHSVVTESEIMLRDGVQKKILVDVDPKGISQRSGIEVEQCLTDISLTEQWNNGASTSSTKKNGFTLDCAKTEKRRMKARRET